MHSILVKGILRKTFSDVWNELFFPLGCVTSLVYYRAQESKRRVSTLQLWNVSKQDLVPFLLKVGKFDDRAIIFVEQNTSNCTALLRYSTQAKNIMHCLWKSPKMSHNFFVVFFYKKHWSSQTKLDSSPQNFGFLLKPCISWPKVACPIET